MNLSIWDQRDALRNAIRSEWVDSFLRIHLASHKWSMDVILPIAKEIVFQYLRTGREALSLYDSHEPGEVAQALRALVENIVIVRPSHEQPGAYKLATCWDISEHGDTHDGEYEQVAPPWKRS